MSYVMYLFLMFFHIFISFHIVRFLHECFYCYTQSKKRKIFLYPVSYMSAKWKRELSSIKTCLAAVYLLIVFVFCGGELLNFIFVFILVMLNACWRTPEQSNILQSNNLTVGYAAALAYYENYLKETLPIKFEERLEYFRSFNKVPVQNKHFILIPESCKIPPYLDTSEGEWVIERCKELPKQEENIGGIKAREYNITVYQVMKRNSAVGTRLTVEYAPPLKGLFSFKEKQNISEKEMFIQRKLFIEALKIFLRDETNTYKLCELIEYDDSKQTAADVLRERCEMN